MPDRAMDPPDRCERRRLMRGDFGGDVDVVVGERSAIGRYPRIGCLRESRHRSSGGSKGDKLGRPNPVRIGSDCLIGNYVCVYEGTTLEDCVVLEDYVRLGYECRVGRGSRLMYRAHVCDRVSIGRKCRVAGFLCDGCVVEDEVTVMGQLVHEYSRPHVGWWDVDEEPPRILRGSVVGMGATVVGGITVGPHAYLAAGSVVTKDVPPYHIVCGVNGAVHCDHWSGERLRSLIEHWGRDG